MIEQNEKATQDVANGEMKAIGFLVGQVMKPARESRPKSGPETYY